MRRLLKNSVLLPFLIHAGSLIFISCQQPRLLQKDASELTLFQTDAVNYARQSYVKVDCPEAWENTDKTSLKGLATNAILDVKGEIVLVTRNGFLHIIDPSDFSKKQHGKISPAISAAPSYYKNLLFIPTELGREGLKAYDLKRGKILWSLKGDHSKSSPLVHDNRVIHSALNGSIRCLNSRTGQEIWSADMKDKITSNLAMDMGYVAAVSINGILRVYDETSGREIWNLDLGQAVHTHPVISDNRIYISTYPGKLYIIDMIKGNILHEYDTETHFYQSVSVDDESIYIPYSDGRLDALDKNSLKKVWDITLHGPHTTEVLVTNNILICSTGQKLIYIINKKQGRILDQIALKGRPKAMPMLMGNLLYLAFEHKHLGILTPLRKN